MLCKWERGDGLVVETWCRHQIRLDGFETSLTHRKILTRTGTIPNFREDQ